MEVQPLFSPYEEWLSETAPDARGPGDEEGFPHLLDPRGKLPQVDQGKGCYVREIPLGVKVSSGGGRSGRCDGTG
ncbi:MAG: hypothetical protein ACUVUP_04485 [Thermaceae bacterium]